MAADGIVPVGGAMGGGLEDMTSRDGWEASLSLTFARRRARTALVRRQHRGPLLVQSPFYPGDGVCHAYILHPPGGIAGGDSLRTQVTNCGGSKALVTTPAATKFYRVGRRGSLQQQRIRVGQGGSFEWLPQENLVFDGAVTQSSTEIDLAAGAKFFGWETWGLGRPARAEYFQSGSLTQTVEVRIASVPGLIERLQLDAGCDAFGAPWGLRGCSAFSTVFAYPARLEELEVARAASSAADGVDVAGATLLGDLLVVRALANGVRALLSWQRALWVALRPRVLGLEASPPRIWAT